MHFDFLAISNVYSYDFVSSFFLTELEKFLFLLHKIRMIRIFVYLFR